MSDKPPIFHIQHVSKSFGGVHALQDVHFEIFPGEVHALLGRERRWQIDTDQDITGSTSRDGRAFLAGSPIRFANTREAQKLASPRSTRSRAVPRPDIAENIMVGRRQSVAWSDWKRMYQEASALLQRLGLALDPRTKSP